MTSPTRAPARRRMPTAVWAAVLLFATTMSLWTVALPSLRSADEVDHVSAALYWADEGDWPGFKQQLSMAQVRNAIPLSGLRWDTVPEQVRPSLTADRATPRPERPTFDELGSGTVPIINKAGQHPPAYSILLGSISTVLPSWASWDLTVWAFRAVSVLLLVPLPLAAAAAARRLGARDGLVVAAAFAVTAVPQLAALGGAVNSDNLLNASAAWVCLGIVLVLTGDLRSRTAAWIGLVSAVALLTKAWALPIVATVLLAYLVAAVRRRSLRPVWRPALVFGAVSMLGGWWWVRNVLVYGTAQPAGHRPSLPDGPLPLLDAVRLTVDQFLEVFASRFWAMLSIKYGESAYPEWSMLVLLLLLVAVTVAGVVRAPRLGLSRGTLLTMSVPAVLTVAILVASVVRLAARTGTAPGVQGRYLYSAIVLVLVLAAVGTATLVRDRWLPLAVGGFGLVFTVVSMGRGISYHFGDDRWSDPIAALPDVVAWSPLPAWATVTLMGLFAAAVLLAAAAVARESLRGDARRPAPVGSGEPTD